MNPTSDSGDVFVFFEHRITGHVKWLVLQLFLVFVDGGKANMNEGHI